MRASLRPKRYSLVPQDLRCHSAWKYSWIGAPRATAALDPLPLGIGGERRPVAAGAGAHRRRGAAGPHPRASRDSRSTALIMRSAPTSIGTAASPVPGMSSDRNPSPALVEAACRARRRIPCIRRARRCSPPPAPAAPPGEPQIAHDLLALERDAHGLGRRVQELAVIAEGLDRLHVIGALAGVFCAGQAPKW